MELRIIERRLTTLVCIVVANLRCTNYGVVQKNRTIFESVWLLYYDDVGRRLIYQNVQLFIMSKSDILHLAIFKYSLHKVRETILHRKYQLIPAIKSGPFLTVCNLCIWWCRKVIHIPNCSVLYLSLIHIWRCRRSTLCRSRWSPYH